MTGFLAQVKTFVRVSSVMAESCVTESMSVLTAPATCGIFNCELTNCPQTAELIQRVTKGTLRATEAWTDGRHAEHDKHLELDYELAVALAPRDGWCSEVHSVDGHSSGAKSWVRGMASIG